MESGIVDTTIEKADQIIQENEKIPDAVFKTVLFNVNHITKTAIKAKKIPKFIYDPLNKFDNHWTLKVAASGNILDSVSKNSPLKYCGTI